MTSLAILCCLLLAAFGCSGADDPDAKPNGEPVETSTSLLEGIEIIETIPPTAEGDEPQPLNQEGPRRGGVLAAPSDWCRIADPAIDGAIEGFGITDMPLVTEIHAGLMKFSDDPNAFVQLELAESYGIQENGLVYEFILRNDLKFSDGTPLTASDVKWSWERALKKSYLGGRGSDIFGLIEGAETIASDDSDDLKGVVVVDDRTLEVRLTKPRAEFTALLADPVASVLKKDNVVDWGDPWENPGGQSSGVRFSDFNMPVGAGPFKLVDYVVGHVPGNGSCSIVRNPQYWGRPAYLDAVWFRLDVMKRQTEGSGDKIMYQSLTDPLAFASEEVYFEALDYITDESEIDPDYPDIIEVEGADFSLYQNIPVISFLVLNAAAPPLDDLHFRRALVASADVEAIRWSSDGRRGLITEDLTTIELPDVHLSSIRKWRKWSFLFRNTPITTKAGMGDTFRRIHSYSSTKLTACSRRGKSC